MFEGIETRRRSRPAASAFKMAFAWIGAALKRWHRSHRDERLLSHQSEHLLNDMGLTRAEFEARLSGRPYY
ncbi:MAG TPA: DUF1127 domain-containing protein [Candidatus Cybelea sp.]|nr:DUF1127 domain-containing protein [Candidatus Cybelea sp.]